MAKPANCIPVPDAKDLYSNWQSSRETLIHRSFPQDPSDFTFSVAELKEYLEYVEQEYSGLGSPGIRIYFGAREDSSNNEATVFLAPTDGTTNTSPNVYSIDPFNWGQSGWPPNVY